MKNIHKIRGKREFLFDDREIAILGGGALIICVLIFVLGFLVGQGLQEKSVASPLNPKDPVATEELSPAEKDVKAVPGVEKKPLETPAGSKKSQLSYFQELPDSETAVLVEATPGKKLTPAPILAEGAQPKKTETTTPQRELKKETPLPQPAPKDEMPPQLVVTPTTAPRKDVQEVAVAPALPNVPKSPTDVMQVGRPARSPEAAKTAPAGAVYSVQVSSSPNKDDAERLQKKYADLGYEAEIMTVDLAAKGVWYRVRVGNLATKEEAEKLKKDILARAGQLAKSPIVTKVNE